MLHIDEDTSEKIPAPKTSSQQNRRDDDRPTVSGIRVKTKTSNSQPERSVIYNVNKIELIGVNLSQHSGTTILPTALVHVEHLGEKFTVRGLIDTGSTRSFILKRVQQKLKSPWSSR